MVEIFGQIARETGCFWSVGQLPDQVARFLCPVGPVFPTNLGQGEKFINPVDPGAVKKVAFRSFQVGHVPIDKVPDMLGFPEILAVNRKEGNF